MRSMPPLRETFFTVFCICLCCLSRRLTSGTPVPLPAAMRRLRDGLMTSGKCRSCSVMELMMASMRRYSRSSSLSRTAADICAAPGILSKRFSTPPMLNIWRIWSCKSTKSNLLPRCTFLASRMALRLSTLRSASSMSVSMSPMPRMRDAMRSGWNASRASVCSPTARNLMGLPVTARTESAAPPRASPSALASTTPVSGSASSNALAVVAASWPLMASTTNSVSTGSSTACSAAISAIIASSMASRPAVSTSSTSSNCRLASARARLAIAVGCSLLALGMKRASTSPLRVCNCSMAAGR